MIKEIFIFERLDYMISTMKSGTRKELAVKFNVSIRTISRMIDTMKNNGAEIDFCRRRNSYFYRTPGKFIVTFEFKNQS